MSDLHRERIQQLIHGHLEHTLSEAEQRELEALLDQHESVRRDLVIGAAMNQELFTLHESLPKESVPPAIQRRPTRRAVRGDRQTPWGVAFAAAAIFIGLVLLFVTSGNEPKEAPRETARHEERLRKEAERRLAEIEERRIRLEQAKTPAVENPEKKKVELGRLEEEKRKIEEDLKAAIAEARRTQKAPAPAPKEATPDVPRETPRETVGTETMVATLERVEGEVHLVGKEGRIRVRANQGIRAGYGLETAARSSALFRYPDGTLLEVSEESVLRDLTAAGGKSLFVEEGAVRAQVAKQPAGQPMRFRTPHGDATVLGTTLRILANKDAKKGTLLEVEEGKVELKNLEGKPVLVESGYFAVAADGAEFVPRRVLREALLVTDTASLNDSDKMINGRLAGLGFKVTVRGAKTVRPREDAKGKALVVISSSLHSAADPAVREFKTIAVPILTWEHNLLTVFGMIRAPEGADAGVGPWTQVRISSAFHPAAAGLSGIVTMLTQPGLLGWQRVAPDAVPVAVLEGDPSKAVIFAYEANAKLVGGEPAPERRIGFTWSDNSAASLTKDGWALFDASVRWLAAKQRVYPK